MENFLKIITQPDNVAILIMIIAVGIATLMAFREMWINDQCIKAGKKEKIYERMTRT